MSDTGETFDDLLDQLGMSDLGKPLTPEERFYNWIIDDKNHRGASLIDWLRHTIHHFHHLLEHDVQVTISGISEKGAAQRPLRIDEYTKIMLEYYLCMYYLPRFQESYYVGATLIEKCDLAATLNLFLEYDGIKKLMSTKNSG